MNTERASTVAIAACCLLALGASAATIDSSVDTTPDDVIDFEAGTLPLPSDEVSDLKRQIQSGSSGQETSRQSTDSGDGEPRERGSQSGSGSRQDRSAGQSGAPDEVPAEKRGTGIVPGGVSLLDRLLALLGNLLELFLSLLPVFILVGGIIATVRFRDRLRVALARLRDRVGLATPGQDPAPGVRVEPAPSNEVTAAWYEMVARIDPSAEPTRTPRQYANAAIAAGADADAVRSLTETFEAVAYGGAPVTERRRAQARRDIRRIRAQLRGSEHR